MSLAGTLAQEMQEHGEKPAFIQFSQVAKHLPKKSEEAGHYVSIDVDYVEIRQPGSVDSVKFPVDEWLQQNKREIANGRLPAHFAQYYEKAYKAWKDGQEIPIEGTPIKGWQLIPPSQQQALLSTGMRTVEEVAQMNEDVQRRVGIGAAGIKLKAKHWLDAGKDRGPLSTKLAALELENAALKETINTLQANVKSLMEQQEQPQPSGTGVVEPISAADLLDDEETKPRGRSGKK